MIEKINKFEKIIESKSKFGTGKTLDMSNGLRRKRTYSRRGGDGGKATPRKEDGVSRNVTEFNQLVQSLTRMQTHEKSQDKMSYLSI
jgi:hypothetical protein